MEDQVILALEVEGLVIGALVIIAFIAMLLS
jgi:hypothetical protein